MVSGDDDGDDEGHCGDVGKVSDDDDEDSGGGDEDNH